MDWELYREKKNKQIAKHRAEKASENRNGEKCKSCGLYGCVCQMNLNDWELQEKLKTGRYMEKLKIIKDWRRDNVKKDSKRIKGRRR